MAISKYKTGQLPDVFGGGGRLSTRGGVRVGKGGDQRPTSGAFSTSQKIKADLAAKRAGRGKFMEQARNQAAGKRFGKSVPRSRTSKYGLQQPKFTPKTARRAGWLTAAREFLRDLGEQWAQVPIDGEYEGFTRVFDGPDNASCVGAPSGRYTVYTDSLPAGSPCNASTTQPTHATFQEAAQQDGSSWPRVNKWWRKSITTGVVQTQWERTGEGDGSPAELTVEVTRYRSTDVDRPTFKPGTPKQPDPAVDADGRARRGSYRIRATEYVWPETPTVAPPYKATGKPVETPRTGRVPWERDDPRTGPAPSPGRSRPYPTPTKTALKDPPPYVPGRMVWHLQVPDRAKKPGQVPLGMVLALKLFHGLTELQDGVEAMFDAVWDNWYPHWRKTSRRDPKKPKSIQDKIAFLGEHWSRMFTDPATMAATMRNLVENEIEDRILGRLYGAGWQTEVRSFRDQYAAGGGAAIEAAYNDPYGVDDGTGIGPRSQVELFPWN